MVLLKAIRKGVDMTVVDQRVVAISPRKLLGPDAEVIIRNKWRRFMLSGVRENKCSDMTENDHGASYEEENLLPLFPVIISVGMGHLSDLGPVGVPQQAESAANQRHGSEKVHGY